MATTQIAARPASIDGCFQTWTEKDAEATLRSDMDMGGYTKVRLRTTTASWLIEATVVLLASQYEDFQTWYRQNCIRGVLPTRVKRPDGKEVVVRFTAAPAIEWPTADRTNFKAACSFEQLPEWRNL